MSTMIPDANALVAYIESFTGSSNSTEIKQCIFLAEMMMRNIELPALRTNPWTTTGVANQWGQVPIPADMNRPILFFNNSNGASSNNSRVEISTSKKRVLSVIANNLVYCRYNRVYHGIALAVCKLWVHRK